MRLAPAASTLFSTTATIHHTGITNMATFSSQKKCSNEVPSNSDHQGPSNLHQYCSGASCMNEATQTCPSCTIHANVYLFCGQDCFKKNWSYHKLLHASLTRPSEIAYQPWPNFLFTGTLRPYPVMPQRTILKELYPHIQFPDYAVDGIPRSEEQSSGRIKVNSVEEIRKMRKVCRLGRQVLDHVASFIRPGITTDALDKIVHEKALSLNCYPSPLNYRNFPKSVCTSVNEVVCHGIPDLRPLQDGDILNIDVTVYHDGHHGDLNETFTVGCVDEVGLRLIKATREALYKAIEIGKNAFSVFAPFIRCFLIFLKIMH
jgi:methionyl aminopeptidase